MMKTKAWMAYSNSLHFSDIFRHIIYIICICKIKDMEDTRFTHFLQKKNKGEKGCSCGDLNSDTLCGMHGSKPLGCCSVGDGSWD